MHRTRAELVLGIWNMEHGRNDAEAVAQVVSFIAAHQLDAIALGETREYAAELRKLRALGYGVVVFTGEPGQADTALVTRPELAPHARRIVRMTRLGWFPVGRRKRTPPKYAPVAELDGITVVVIHPAPSVRFPEDGPEGPAARVLSTIQHRRGEARLARAVSGPLVIAGDWNAVPEAPGRYAPRWQARRLGLDVIAPDDATHGRRTIDYALTRGLHGQAVTEGRGGSDHALVILRLHRKSSCRRRARARLEGKAAAAPKQEILR